MKKWITAFSMTLLFMACGSSTSTEPSESDEVLIGTQTWKNQNLNTRNFRNGDSITLCGSAEEWRDAFLNKEPAMVYYDFDTEFGKEHGAMYNVWAVLDERKIAPAGWHIPSVEEVKLLFGDHPLGPLLLSVKGNRLDNNGPWPNKMYGVEVMQDSLGFHAYPAGEIPNYTEALNKIDFNGKGELIAWWSSTALSTDANALHFWNIYQNRGGFHGGVAGSRMDAAAGHYLRLIKD